MTTAADVSRQLVIAHLEAGLDEEEISRRLAIPLRRVERIAEEWAGAGHAEDDLAVPAPAPEAGPRRALVVDKPKVEGHPSKFRRPAEHGTDAGWAGHRRRLQDPCPECVAAHEVVLVENRAARAEMEARRKGVRPAAAPPPAPAGPDLGLTPPRYFVARDAERAAAPPEGGQPGVR